jgi:hypothetical protein
MNPDSILRVKQYTFSDELFSQGFAQGRGPCTCTSVCCEGGVYADIAERDRIMELRDIIRKHMDATQPQDPSLWFELSEQEDADFPSGRCVGTEEFNGKCVFLDSRGRCSIQVAAVAQGLDRWAWKPLFCILFPIEVSGNVVNYDPMLQGEQPCCTTQADYSIPLFRACRDELIHLLGQEGYDMLEEHYRNRALAKEGSSRNI